jgi:large conductance mechanosensitive channel
MAMINGLAPKVKPVWGEFRTFIARGNVIDLAVGIIIGGAFSSVTNSLVRDIIMPPIGLLLAKVDFAELYINLTAERYASLAEAEAAGAATINYGRFINNIINFMIIAVVIFFLVRWVNRMTAEKPEPVAAPVTKACPYCQTTIPIKATRCPNCTSPLEGEDIEDAD